jgi:mono/diheme cytochrome c family protein
MGAIAGIALMVAVTPMASGADFEAGKEIYSKKCQSCHGADGKGNPGFEKILKKKIPDFTDTDVSKLSKAKREELELEFRTVIAEGKSPMPAFGKSLSKEDRESVLEYLEKAFMKGGK